MADPPLFTCPICKRPSWHSRDAEERFCGSCGFVDDVLMERRITDNSRDGEPPEDAANG